MFRLALSLFLFLGLLFSSTSYAEKARVAVAANFYPALNELVEDFEKTYKHRVQLVVGSSGKLAAQIIQGAPFDLFLSADGARPLELEKRELIVPGSRRTYATGRLTVTSGKYAEANPLDQLMAGNFERLAMANPDLAPYGRAAEQSLDALSLNPDRKQIIYGENLSQTYHFLHTGHVDLAFVALSQVLDKGLDDDRFALVPETLYQPIEQQMVLLNGNKAAAALHQYILSAIAQKQIAQLGYKSALNPDVGEEK